MTSSADRVVEALRQHPRRAMTSTELAAKVGAPAPAALTEVLDQLRAERAVVVLDALPPDPHFPPISAVALVEEPAGDAALGTARDRAQECARVLQRQMLRGHRCQ